ncbi:MAG: hypothetical protein HKO65_20340 [Gemmatimonadetes bacterium]|nr:hypothetical protein [Gemmatimonadota bacterium]NNM07451.1 hypothetical protein [Gemmatimonadota bacterium]
MNAENKGSGTLIALAMVGSVVVGFAGLLGAVFAFLNVDAVGFGVSLVASALSFGLLANALLRS